jgi:hypothetical protein
VAKWKQLLEPMMDWMNSKKEKFMVAGLDTFCVILENGADDFYVLIPKLMGSLYSMFTNEKVCAS